MEMAKSQTKTRYNAKLFLRNCYFLEKRNSRPCKEEKCLQETIKCKQSSIDSQHKTEELS